MYLQLIVLAYGITYTANETQRWPYNFLLNWYGMTQQGLILEAIGPLSQLLEAINDPNPQVSLDQIGEAVETTINLLANAYYKTFLMRRARILKEYNKELVTFAEAQERNWASAAPQLFWPNFLKEAADYLQHLQLIHKVKQPWQNFQQPPFPEPARGLGRRKGGEGSL